jgi:acyl-coenzyme A thioesterase PaaI-like protein
MARKISPRLLRVLLNLYPPYVGAGIRVAHIAPDFRSATVEMPLRWYNRNYFGTHFGGSLYAMTDPFFALLVLHNLSSDYRVWDRAASITFLAPGRGRMRAEFVVTAEDLATIERMTASGDKHLHLFNADIVDAEGLVVARVDKVVYVRRSRGAPASEPGASQPFAAA